MAPKKYPMALLSVAERPTNISVKISENPKRVLTIPTRLKVRN